MRKYILTSLGIFLADQIIKAIATSKIPDDGIFAVSGHFLKLLFRISYNTHLAWSIALPAILEMLLPLILIVFLFYAIARQFFNGKMENFVLAAIAGAAISNLADRFFYGGVVDFISASVYNFTWPSFNFADIIITFGAIFLIIRILFPPTSPAAEAGGK